MTAQHWRPSLSNGQLYGQAAEFDLEFLARPKPEDCQHELAPRQMVTVHFRLAGQLLRSRVELWPLLLFRSCLIELEARKWAPNGTGNGALLAPSLCCPFELGLQLARVALFPLFPLL